MKISTNEKKKPNEYRKRQKKYPLKKKKDKRSVV